MTGEQQYLDLLKQVINGGKAPNRTGVDTYRIINAFMEFDLTKSFPLLTTKKVWFKGVVGELIWMLQGDTNIKFLLENSIGIWTDDAYRYYLQMHKSGRWNKVNAKKIRSSSEVRSPITKEEFVDVIKNTPTGYKLYGSTLPVYFLRFLPCS